MGGDLASVHTEEQMSFIQDLKLEEGSTPWLGGSDSESEGSWYWTDGRPWNNKFWASTEPNNYGAGEDCLALYSGEKPFYDAPCNRQLTSVCQQGSRYSNLNMIF